MPNVTYIAKALEGRKEGKDWRCLCPVHDGHHFIITDKRGTFQMHCLMGAKHEELQRALESRGLWEQGSYGSSNGHAPTRRPQTKKLIAEYFYRDPEGEIVAVKGRFETDVGKTFLWRKADDQNWSGLGEGQGKTLPLYGAELVNGDSVWFVEGEKAADACRDYGLTAVCGYSGASVVPTPEVLSVLSGRHVIIWPDNDPPGRTFALKLKTALGGIATAQILPDLGLPDRADAFDFFKLGGTPEKLTRLLRSTPLTPTIETTDRGFLVTLPEGGGFVRLQFDDVTHGRHRIDAKVKVWLEMAGQSAEPFSERLNLLSGSNRTEVRRALDECYDMGKGFWTRALNKAVAMTQEAIENHDPSIRIADAPDVPDDGYIVPPVLRSTGATIWFGDGGSLKSYQALALAKEVCEGGRYLGCNCAERAVIYVDYETDVSTVRRRLKELGGYPDNFYYWPGRGTPLAEMVPALQRKIEKDIVGLVIIDSAIPACGGEPEKADTARAYFAALAQLGNIATLTISHVTKAGEDQYPFGSIMWNNLARLTWNVKSHSEEGDNVQHLMLLNRKVNDDRRHRPIGLRAIFAAGEVRIEREEIRDNELTKHLPLIQQVRRALAGGARSTKDLAADLDVSEMSIRKQCNRLRDRGEATTLGRGSDGSNLWGLSA